jgi:hypothetical protein
MEAVREDVVQHFGEVFRVSMQSTTLEHLLP